MCFDLVMSMKELAITRADITRYDVNHVTIHWSYGPELTDRIYSRDLPSSTEGETIEECFNRLERMIRRLFAIKAFTAQQHVDFEAWLAQYELEDPLV